jgi:hypothetical protein
MVGWEKIGLKSSADIHAIFRRVRAEEDVARREKSPLPPTTMTTECRAVDAVAPAPKTRKTNR